MKYKYNEEKSLKELKTYIDSTMINIIVTTSSNKQSLS